MQMESQNFTLRNLSQFFVAQNSIVDRLATMVSFSVIRNVAARSRALLLNATQQQQRRTMSLGGHHGPPPEWTGVDKVVRKYFPEDYQRKFLLLAEFRIP